MYLSRRALITLATASRTGFRRLGFGSSLCLVAPSDKSSMVRTSAGSLVDRDVTAAPVLAGARGLADGGAGVSIGSARMLDRRGKGVEAADSAAKLVALQTGSAASTPASPPNASPSPPVSGSTTSSTGARPLTSRSNNPGDTGI